MLVNGKMTSSAYQSAGVDLQGIESLKERIGAFASLTHGPEVLKGVGAFAGLYRLRNYKNPVLAASTDGVGTKMKVASLLGHYESLGIDLVNLNVNDIVTCGAHPLLFLDYISLGKLDPQIVEPLLRGMVWACREVDCALVGGETAQMPGLYADGEFDLAGTVVGAVEESAIIDGSDVVEGDILLGLPSSGLHTNGFSLVRKVFDIDDNPSVLYQQYQDLGHSLGEELIKPHQCYYQTLKPHFGRLKAVVHVSGGGLPNNIPRLLALRSGRSHPPRRLGTSAYLQPHPERRRDRPTGDVPGLQYGPRNGPHLRPRRLGVAAALSARRRCHGRSGQAHRPRPSLYAKLADLPNP